MAKGSGKSTTNLLRLSGIIFSVMGAYHVLRYVLRFEIKMIELTYLGSFVLGVVFLILAGACFANSKK